MSQRPGHKLIRPPFPLPQAPPAPVAPGTQGPGVQRRPLADTTTLKQSEFTAPRSPKQTRPLADVDTWKNPVPQAHQVHDQSQQKNLFLANAIAQYRQLRQVAAPAAPMPIPMPPPILYQTGFTPQNKHAPLSSRQKIRRIGALVLLLIPTLLIIFELINAITIYAQAQDGISHLQAAGNLFHGGSASYFDTQKLDQAQAEITAARADFASLSSRFDHDGSIALLAGLWPTQINTGRSLAHLATTGLDVTQQFLQTAHKIAPAVAPALQESSTGNTDAPLKPYLTPSAYHEIMTTLLAITPQIHQMARDAQGVSPDALPMSSKQRETLNALLLLLPALDTVLPQVYNSRNALGWLLGIDAQRSFLIEPMDTAELRATGGFTGQFGELTLNGAHMGPLKLSNIGKYEEDHTAEGSPPDLTIYPKVIGQHAPQPYANWWPVANFGLRDANLSADFPTSAQIALDRYSYEFGKNLDGVIMFTPALIQHVLHATGPIQIPLYHQTVTEQNLQDLLHYYQLNNTGIYQEEVIEHVQDTQLARKLFTQRVTQALMSTVTHLPLNKILPLANEMLRSLKTKDLQIYMTNPQLESLVGKYGSIATLDRSTTHDGLFIVQANVSASKASQYVTTSIQDAITLDTQGGATHHLLLALDYQQKGDVYGFDTYRDYVRVYVPPGSQLLGGNGFDLSGRPYCGDEASGYVLCQADVYGDGSLVCKPPIEIGSATSYLNDPYAGKDHPLDVTGPPSNVQSDETGRAMFGGWVVIPKNCTMKVTLSWYVPPLTKQPYSLLVQAQAAVSAPLDLTIRPAACTPSHGQTLPFSQQMDGEDLFLHVKQQGTQCLLLSP